MSSNTYVIIPKVNPCRVQYVCSSIKRVENVWICLSTYCAESLRRSPKIAQSSFSLPHLSTLLYSTVLPTKALSPSLPLASGGGG